MSKTRLAGLVPLLLTMGTFFACGGGTSSSTPTANKTIARTAPNTAEPEPEYPKVRTTEENLALLDRPARIHAEYLIRLGHPNKLDAGRLEVGDVGKIDEPIEVFQIVDQRSFIGEIGSRNVWIDVPSTSGVADGDRLRMRDVFHVVGTKQYLTALGSPRTIYHLEVIEVGLAEEIADRELDREREEQREKEVVVERQARDARMHEFVDKTGKFRVRGIFLKMEEGKVFIEKEDGTEIDVPASRLSGDDLHFIREFAKEQRSKGADARSPGRGVADKTGLRPGL